GMIIFSFIAASLMKYTRTGKAFTPEMLVPFGTILLMSVLTGYLAYFLVDRAKKLTYRQIMKWILPGLFIFYGGAFIIANISVSLGILGWFIATGKDLGGYFHQLFTYELTFANRRLLLWLFFFSIAFFYILWRKTATKEQQFREEMLKYQYQTLKSQINPHFLFNSLNTLSQLVYEDPARADNYIQELSKVYRYIIENEETRLVPLESEMEFVRQYFNLYQVRDKEKIHLNVSIAGIEKFRIIPVSLQLLVENAIKHNSFSVRSPLIIDITGSDGMITVSNNMQPKSTLEQSTGKGLANLRERIRLIMNKEIIIEESADRFSVSLPVTSI
ncbi:MAG TPA: histidine kinase, partial [Bacteroidales bacterium]|nr:histidine kinase [Bacteroidales bacterium]